MPDRMYFNICTMTMGQMVNIRFNEMCTWARCQGDVRSIYLFIIQWINGENKKRVWEWMAIFVRKLVFNPGWIDRPSEKKQWNTSFHSIPYLFHRSRNNAPKVPYGFFNEWSHCEYIYLLLYSYVWLWIFSFFFIIKMPIFARWKCATKIIFLRRVFHFHSAIFFFICLWAKFFRADFLGHVYFGVLWHVSSSTFIYIHLLAIILLRYHHQK